MTNSTNTAKFQDIRVAMNLAADLHDAAVLVTTDAEARYQAAAGELGIDLLITADGAAADDHVRDQNMAEDCSGDTIVSRAWQAVHEACAGVGYQLTAVDKAELASIDIEDDDTLVAFMTARNIDSSEADYLRNWCA